MLLEVGFDNFVLLPLPHAEQLKKIFSTKQKMMIFDIGACEGEDSIRYKKLFPNATVHAFEPVPSNFKMVNKNIADYKLEASIFASPLALSHSSGGADFFVSSGAPTSIELQPNWDYGNKSSSLLKPEKTLEVVPWLKFDKKIRVKTERLDTYCKKHLIDRINLIHIDVQGAELMVLKGAGDMINRIDAIWMEVEAVELYKGQPLKNDVEEFMRRAGFDKYLDTVDSVAGDQLYVRSSKLPSLLNRISNSLKVKTKSISKKLGSTEE
jgi:2-O-methyltransferase